MYPTLGEAEVVLISLLAIGQGLSDVVRSIGYEQDFGLNNT